MRSPLQPLYRVSLWLAGLFMIAMLATILVSILGRQFDFYIRGIDSYAGYFMAAASFLALAGTLVQGDHIRVTLVISRFTGTKRRAFEIFCLILAIAISGAFAFYSVKMAWWSWKFNDISTSNDATPLWIPQLGMAVGTVIFCIAYVEELVLVLLGKPLNDQSAELARTE
ncbi:TRAP transporter small permease [uncultured Ferrovibrio sp.]|jgi:TRAP-type C4-dicarboxylate transport system permease small subunit|uniref:TRAP transporter small permease n=1 Tax=uncultured Ferrovibrio sp. TaxID=1576913 RepID=UPI002612D22F|nr:TRAP transporter small permease [uncultured Ferrovibrio sp.]